MTVHNMRRSLRVARNWTDAPWWEQVYREAFPSFEGMIAIHRLGSGQRDGIDRHVALTNGRTIAIDEKVRELDYDDFLLEYWSVQHKTDPGQNTEGWIAKDLRADYIAYAFAPSGRCYLLPFQELRRAWKRYRHQWVACYRRVVADNGHYETVSVAVPIDVVLRAVADSTLVRFTPEAAAA